MHLQTIEELDQYFIGPPIPPTPEFSDAIWVAYQKCPLTSTDTGVKIRNHHFLTSIPDYSCD